jgi:hypothetical protein
MKPYDYDMGYFLRNGTPTRFFDSKGVEICIGDIVRKECTSNPELHGPWVEYTVELRGLSPVLMYLRSAKGQILQPGYAGSCLTDYYDRDAMLFSTSELEIQPDDEEIIVVGKIEDKKNG